MSDDRRSKRSQRRFRVPSLAAAAAYVLCFYHFFRDQNPCSNNYNNAVAFAFSTTPSSSTPGKFSNNNYKRSADTASGNGRQRRPSNNNSNNGNSFSAGSSSSTKNKRWFQQRKAGVTVSKRTKPPQWEREGDDLYTSYNMANATMATPQSRDEARALLRSIEVEQSTTVLSSSSLATTTTSPVTSETTGGTVADNEPSNVEDKPFLWGGLSVGPIWKSRLLKAGFQTPTPIQRQAFDAILQKKTNNKTNKQRQNVVLASPTGSGKSLAYLLPFLTTLNMPSSSSLSKKGSASEAASVGSVWIVTPTVELACQIQQVVQRLVQAEGELQLNQCNNSILHVLQSSRDNDFEDSSFPLLSQIQNCKPLPIMIAGTPKLLLQLRKEIKNALPQRRRYDSDHPADPSIQPLAKTLFSSLEAVILDETDRLLQTKPAPKALPTANGKRAQPSSSIPAAQELLEKLVMDSSYRSSRDSYNLQVVCASATVGRSLRRQLMEILGEPSMDKAAALVTADLRTKKSASDRKASLLPSNLQHACLVINQEVLVSSSSTSILLQGLEQAMHVLDAQPSIVFPGPVGVEDTKVFLQSNGFKDVRGLSEVGNADLDMSNNKVSNDWKSTPIYVIKERLGRGLDLTNVKYVFLLGVPSNAASYAHLAGRTARQQGEVGTCVTVLEPRETPKLVLLAETLGFSVKCVE